jgi:hypothetical protein
MITIEFCSLVWSLGGKFCIHSIKELGLLLKTIIRCLNIPSTIINISKKTPTTLIKEPKEEIIFQFKNMSG